MKVALDVLVAEEDVIVVLDVVVELVLLEGDNEAPVEEEHVDEELVLALVLLMDGEHVDKEVVDEVLAAAGRTG